MPMYLVHFYRAGETEPYHRWAPFGSADDHTAEATVRVNVSRNTAVNGTLAAATRFTLQEATPGAPAIERTI